MADDERRRDLVHDQLATDGGDKGIQREGDAGVSSHGRAHWRRLTRGIPCAIQASIVCSVILAEHCFLCSYVVFTMGPTCSLNSRSLVLFCEGRQRETRKPVTSLGFLKEGYRDHLLNQVASLNILGGDVEHPWR